MTINAINRSRRYKVLTDGSRVDVVGGSGGGGVSVSSISGSYTQGGAMTISGSGFSAQRNGMLECRNFGSLSVGAAVATTLSASGYVDNGAGSRYLVTNADSMFGDGKCARVQAGSGSSIDGLRWQYPSGVSALLFSFWAKVVVNSEGEPEDPHQLKVSRITGSTADDHTIPPAIGMTWEREPSSETVSAFYRGSPEESNAWFGSGPTAGQWFRVTQYLKCSTAGVADGERLLVTSFDESFTYSGYPGGNMASPSATYTAASWGRDQFITRSSGVTNTIKQCYFPFYKRDLASYDVYIDRPYINDSLESVWFGDASTWAACSASKRVPQPVTARSSSSITITADVGPLSTGAVYAYVMNADGAMNATGYLVRAS